ncbi:ENDORIBONUCLEASE DICER-like protein 1, partial [Salix koriyanagi]
MESESNIRVSGIGGGGGGGPSYWLDACEDISCDIIDDFVDFDTSVVQELSVDNNSNVNNDFFGGIDHILDSIKNGSGLPPPHSASTTNNVSNGSRECIVGDGWFINVENGVCHGSSVSQSNGGDKDIIDRKGQVENVGNGLNLANGKREERFSNNFVKENGKKDEQSTERGIDSDERCGKRARLGCYRNERVYSSRGHHEHRDRERGCSRKRSRDWDESDRRDRDSSRRRDRYSGSNRRDGRDRDWRERELRGYWERDRSGSKEMVFRLGTWEADRNKEGREASDKIQECKGELEKKSEESKEKVPEEQARQYQLDVLDQAKKKNTIAFLETGAGKTLIAVFLIKSICNDLQRQNKKILAVFLVPKVPLVYQQAEVIREGTGYQVGRYCGEMGQDFWDTRRWQHEFETKQ